MSRFILCAFSLFILVSCGTNLLKSPEQDSNIVVLADDKNKDLKEDDHKLKVALIVPLNKQKDYIGLSIVNSAQLAIQNSNYDAVNLVILDSDKINNAPDELLNELEMNQIKVIIGPLYSLETKKLVELLQNKDITILSLSNDSSINSDSLLMMGITPSSQTITMMEYAISQGISSFHLILPKSKLGHLINGAAGDVISEKNGISYTANWYNMITEEEVINKVISSLEHDNNQAVFMPQGDNSLVYLDKALNKFKPHTHLMGLQSWENNSILHLANFNNAILLKKNIGDKNFYSKFNSVFGTTATNIDFIAYNALTMIINMYKNNLDLSKQSIISANTEDHKYSDVYFNLKGLSFYDLPIIKIHNKNFVEVEYKH